MASLVLLPLALDQVDDYFLTGPKERMASRHPPDTSTEAGNFHSMLTNMTSPRDSSEMAESLHQSTSSRSTSPNDSVYLTPLSSSMTDPNDESLNDLIDMLALALYEFLDG